MSLETDVERAVRRQMREATKDLVVATPPFDRVSRRSRVLRRRRVASVVVSIALAAGTVAWGITALAQLSTEDRPVPGITTAGGAPTVGAREAQPIRTDGFVAELQVAGGQVWALTYSEDERYSVIRIAAGTGDIVGKPFDLGGPLVSAFAVGDGGVWAVMPTLTGPSWDKKPGVLVRLDPSTGKTVARIPVGLHPQDVTVGGGSVWVSNSGDDTVTRVDPSMNRVVATIPVAHGPEDLAYGFGTLWVESDFEMDELQRLDPGTNEIVATIPDVVRPVMGDGVVWVDGPGRPNGAVVQIDPATNRFVGRPFPLDIGPSRVVAGEGTVWLGRWFEDTSAPANDLGPFPGTFQFHRYDVHTGELTGPPISVNGPTEGVISAGALWLPLEGDHTILRVPIT